MKTFIENIKDFLNGLNQKTTLLVAAGSLIILGWAVYWLVDFLVLFNSLMITATLLAGVDIGRRAWRGLMNKHTNIDLLVSIAAVGGLAIGVYWEAAAVTFLFLLGGWLEAHTLSKTRNTLKELINLAPAKAIVLKRTERNEIAAQNVERGQLVLVKPGSKIPVDGKVEEGYTTVDESAVTGEPLPVEKNAGAEVFAGTINQNGLIKVRAKHSGANTTLAKVIHRIEEAQEDKAPTQRFIERFAGWYTPAIIALSIGAFLITQNIVLALTLLVIGCPGALVISTPVSVITGIGWAAQKGILIKGGEYLESAGNITAVALDKTGTLTEGKPKITDIIRLKPGTAIAGDTKRSACACPHYKLNNKVKEVLPEDVLELIYRTGLAETGSEHPLARSFIAEAEKYFNLPEPDYFEAHTGFGIQAVYNGDTISVGNGTFMQKLSIDLPLELQKKTAELASKGRTVVMTALNGTLLGAIGITDPVRPAAKEMVTHLKQTGIDRIVMLTGDREDTAKAVAAKTEIENVQAKMLPDDKLEAMKKMKENGHKVAMVGDGINDAPAMATADISIAMGAAGTDVAIETADIALIADDLTRIPEALQLSKRTLRNINQNVIIALVTVTALLAGVFTGIVHMAGGMLIHELSVMLVILNGLRLKWL